MTQLQFGILVCWNQKRLQGLFNPTFHFIGKKLRFRPDREIQRQYSNLGEDLVAGPCGKEAITLVRIWSLKLIFNGRSCQAVTLENGPSLLISLDMGIDKEGPFK